MPRQQQQGSWPSGAAYDALRSNFKTVPGAYLCRIRSTPATIHTLRAVGATPRVICALEASHGHAATTTNAGLAHTTHPQKDHKRTPSRPPAPTPLTLEKITHEPPPPLRPHQSP
eukprot:365111-Chlamydomonas_euryale.AAC.8